MTIIDLNEHGMAIWRHKFEKTLFAERSYYWVDRIVVICESGSYRHLVDDLRFSTFNFSCWEPVTVAEYEKVKSFYKDIYEES